MRELEDSETEPIVPLEEKVYQVEDNLANEYEEEEECKSPDLLGVVRCILTKAKTQKDWCRTSILHTFVNLGDKVCKIIIDSGSCVNAISANTIKPLGLPMAPHPNTYKVSWIDSTSIPIKSRCLV